MTVSDDRLIEEIYAATLEPQRYDAVVALWHEHFENRFEDAGTGMPQPPSFDTLEPHFAQAERLYERLGRVGAQHAAHARDEASVVLHLDASARIVEATGAARRSLALSDTQIGPVVERFDVPWDD